MHDPIIAISKLRTLRSKLLSKKVSIGSWVQLPSPITTQLLASAGYDWIAIDLEHGSIDFCHLDNLIRSIEISNSIPLVRLPDHSVTTLRRSMDAGFYGVIIPNISTKSQLKMMISNLSWPPTGQRGVGFCAANNFGLSFKQYSEFSVSPFVVPMIESVEGVANIDSILSLNPDAVIVGPYDLSASLGLVGQLSHPKVLAAIDSIYQSCTSNSIPFGIHQVSPSQHDLHRLIDNGYTFIPYSIDSVFFSTSVTFPLPE